MDKKEKRVLDEVNKLAESYKGELEEAGKRIATNIFKHGMQPQEAFAIPKSKTEGLYAQAYQLYNAGNFKKAYQTFELLTLLNNGDARYPFGMAACLQALKEYRQAFYCYLQSVSMDQDNPVPYYHASDCCLKVGDKISAVVMLHLTIERCVGKPEFEPVRDRASILKENLTRELNEEGKKLYGHDR